MGSSLDAIINYIDIFLLVLVRVTALFVLSPIFGSKNVPNYIKIAFSGIIALIITPTLDINQSIEYNGLLQFVLVVINEFLVGLILGFICYMAFICLYLAGQIIDMQIGFGIVNVIDPQSKIQIPVIANFYNIIALLMFLSINGHHMIISSIFYSYEVLPAGTAVISNILLDNMVQIFSQMFVIGFKIAAPIIAVIFITNVALGILARTVPQMNVFVVGMPLKIFVGIAMLIFIMPMFSIIMDNIATGMFQDIATVMKDMMKK